MSKAWKKLERRIAKTFGTFRTPLSGSSSRHTASDTLHDELYIEVKYSGIKDSKGGKQITIKKEWLDEMIYEAKREDKIPMLAFQFKGDTTGNVWTILPMQVMQMLYPVIREDDGLLDEETNNISSVGDSR
ncbi:MAG: hypothetical protein CI952_78 [Methanohalophilus sp.]|nr:MAG: hypothetical protein CI952_78 [Methanohalophilus sp.]